MLSKYPVICRQIWRTFSARLLIKSIFNWQSFCAKPRTSGGGRLEGQAVRSTRGNSASPVIRGKSDNVALRYFRSYRHLSLRCPTLPPPSVRHFLLSRIFMPLQPVTSLYISWPVSLIPKREEATLSARRPLAI